MIHNFCAAPYALLVKIASTTLTGNNASIIGDALRSVVDWVDTCLVIDTGVSDESLAVAEGVAGAKFVLRRFDWIRDFSAARNFALDAAHAVGADWAITVDTDERIQPNGEDLRAGHRTPCGPDSPRLGRRYSSTLARAALWPGAPGP